MPTWGNRFVRHYVERDLPEIVETGCDYVVHTVSEHDLAFHAGEVGALVAATRDAGLEAWLDCWGLGGLFAGEAFSDFLLRHPDSWQVRPGGERVPAACPNAPAFRNLLEGWLDAAAGAGADAVFFDDPAAPADGTCACAHCRAPGADGPGGSASGGTFPQRSLVRLIGDACERAGALGLRTAVGVLPGFSERGDVPLLGQLTAVRAVDVIAVSPLWRAHGRPVSPYVRDACAAVVAACRDSGQVPMAWLQAFSIPARREDEIARAAEAMVEAGIGNVAAWCFRAGEQMTAVRSERPRLAWETVRAAFRRLRAVGGG